MFTVEIFAVGKLNAAYFRDGCAEYEKRLTRFCNIKVTQADEEKLQNERDSEKQRVIEAESARLEKLMKDKKLFTVALCSEGKQYTSEELAALIKRLQMTHSGAAFLIGGSLGLSGELKKTADLRLSLGSITLPHQLARLVLLEQLYRAFTINENIKYHK